MTVSDAEIRQLQYWIDHASSDHPERGAKLHDLGVAYRDRHLNTNDTTDIKTAVKYLQQSVDITSPDDPERVRRLMRLGVGYGLRCQRTGDTADLDIAIKHLHEAIELTLPHHPDRSDLLDSLATAYNNRYYRTGSIADQDASIEYCRAALDQISPGHPDYTRRLNILGVGYDNRSVRTGNTADINMAIQLLQESVERTSLNDPERDKRLHSLGVGYGHRYERIRDATDLDKAIENLQASIDLAPSHRLELASRFDCLGIYHIHRYERTNNGTDLDVAIGHFSASIDLTPSDHPDLARRLNSLGVGYHHRYDKTANVVDINKSIEHLEEAVQQTSEHHTERTARLESLAAAYNHRCRGLGSTSDLDKSIERLAEAIRVTASATQARLKVAVKSLLLCAGTGRLKEAYDTVCAAMPLITLLTLKSLKNSDKQYLLAQVAGFASDSAAIALSVTKDAFEAVQLLELGRGVISGSLIEMRTDVTMLSSVHPELGEEFVCLRDMLDSPEIPKSEESPASENNLSNLRYDAQKKMEKLISTIRNRQGFDDFLLAPKRDDIQSAAASGAIVIVNVSQYRCDAILVEQHTILSIPLTKLSIKDIEKKGQQDRDLGSSETLCWMWDTIASPVLEALGIVHRSDDEWSRIWWIPTGLLTKFPLHAAGRHQEAGSRTVLDRVISSYSSSIKAIVHRRATRPSQGLQAGSSQALLVAVPNVPGSPPLPYAKKEVDIVREVLETMTVEPIQSGYQKHDIVACLAHCKIFHFAGHGVTDLTDPSRSYLLLGDGESDQLTVASILEISVRNNLPLLAYLSACGTGQIKDKKLFDESIHLISAFQLAGFRHVIGTLWAVDDEVCVEIARTTYEGIRREGMTDTSICLGLHHASRKLRDRWLSKKDRNLRRRSRVRNASHGEDRQLQSGRKINFSEDEQGREEESLSWVPYVHYGV